MEITWFGHACFRITSRGLATVVTDPFDHAQTGYAPLKLKADVVSVSHDSPHHSFLPAVAGSPFVVNAPGEYEIGGVFMAAAPTHRLDAPDEQHNTLFTFNYDGVVVAHLGAMNRIPAQSEVEDLGPVHIALVPVGGGAALNAARAAEAISLLEPNIVIPMCYATPDSLVSLDPINKFLKEMGITEVETQPILKVSADPSTLPEETRVVILDYQRN